MKTKRIFATIAIIVAIALSSCGGKTPATISTNVPQSVAAANTQAPTLAPTMTAVPTGTPLPTKILYFVTPPALSQLPTDLLSNIIYQQPPADCASSSDMNITCSTLRGQSVSGNVTLQPGQGQVWTGDEIELGKDGVSLVTRPVTSSHHDLWFVLNLSSKPVSYFAYAPDGSFRAKFTINGEWNNDSIANVINLHLQRFLNPQDEQMFTPTPVANCEQVKAGCDETALRALVISDSGIQVLLLGIYSDQTGWQAK